MARRTTALVLALFIAACGASESQLREATEKKARVIAEGSATGIDCTLLELPDGIDQDPNEIPFMVRCADRRVCSAGRDKKHRTDDDICAEIPSLVTPKQALKQHVAAARDALREGDPEKAQEAVDAARVLEPDDPRLLALQGRIHERSGQPDQGLRTTRVALAANPQLVDASLGLMEHYVGVVERFDPAAPSDAEFPIFAELIRLQGLDQLVERMRAALDADSGHREDLDSLAKRIEAQRRRLEPLRESSGERESFAKKIIEDLSRDLGVQVRLSQP